MTSMRCSTDTIPDSRVAEDGATPEAGSEFCIIRGLVTNQTKRPVDAPVFYGYESADGSEFEGQDREPSSVNLDGVDYGDSVNPKKSVARMALGQSAWPGAVVVGVVAGVRVRREGRARHLKDTCVTGEACGELRNKCYTVTEVIKMTLDQDQTPHVRARGDSVEVQGVSTADVEQALILLGKVRQLQQRQAALVSDQLLRGVLPAAGLDLTPPAAVEQARRQADLRHALLATPVYTYETLREVRGDSSSANTRTWVSRVRKKGRLFTVVVDGHTLIPAFQLTDGVEPRPELAKVLRPLLEAGVNGWALWIWLTHPTALLSGDIPCDALGEAAGRVEKAASRFAARQGSTAA